MCHLFLLVAKLYIEAKSKEGPDTSYNKHVLSSQELGAAAEMVQFDLSGLGQFDPYLSALGLAPNSAWPTHHEPSMQAGLDVPQGMSGSNVGNRYSLQDWFSGSRYIMGLMEDDLNMPDIPNLN